ncbi:hypothetical protein Tco_0607235, partial [Tanacetum coccineum]
MPRTHIPLRPNLGVLQIGSPMQGGHMEEGKHKRKLGFALESLTMKAQELHNGLPRW